MITGRMQSAELASVFRAVALLLGSSKTDGAADLKSVLASRLDQYYHAQGQNVPEQTEESLETLQLRTALEALSIVEKAQGLLTAQTQSGSEEAGRQQLDMIGTRDLAQIRTLLSVLFKWAIQPLLTSVIAAIPTVTPGARRRAEVNVIDLTAVPDDYKVLSDTLMRLLVVILPRGQHGPPNPSLITNVLLDRFLLDILRPCMVLGWLPKSAASESVAPIDDLRPRVVHLINIVPTAQSIATLSALLSEASTLSYVKKACSFLLGRQLLRSEGVRGMLSSLFSEEDTIGGDAPLEKLENVAKLLHSLPAGISETQYFGNIISQLLSILLSDPQNTPISHKRAASFILSRFLIGTDKPDSSAASRILLPTLQRPLLHVASTSATHEVQNSARGVTALDIVRVLETLLVNTDPSPILISRVLTPIIPSLFALSSKLEKVKISDPTIKFTIQGLLRTWGRLIETSEGTATIWLIVGGEGGEWSVDVAGEISLVEPAEDSATLALFTPEDLQHAEEAGELDIDANILNLKPDPSHFVTFLRSLDRPDIASQIFVRLLDAYRETKAAQDSDPTKTLLYLQIVMKLQTQSNPEDPSDILKQPDQILSFVKHALEATNVSQRPKPPTRNKMDSSKGLSLADLRIVEEEVVSSDSDGGDSDDEDAGDSDEEMTSTALNLLLSVLEANPDLSTQTMPILDDIFSLLEILAKQASESVKPLAREALMVLVARLASSSIPKKKEITEECPERKYQKALKLLQDPILPVRAHGLLLLRELVSSKKDLSSGPHKPDIDPALIPGILSIFMQSIQDDDSYIFLNAVQGLSAMADAFGKDALRSLIDAYSKGLEGIAAGSLTKQDMDVRTRIGEALGQVIRRCGDALPNYANILIPPLFAVVRGSHFPSTLRTSALSLLAICVNTSPLAVLSYAADLAETMIDMLQLETVSISSRLQADPASESLEEDDKKDGENKSKAWRPDSIQFKPTTTNTKVPPFRRAALHLLSLIMRAYASQVDHDSVKAIYVLPPETLRRARVTAGYVAATDEDSIVRVMAREVVDEVDNLAEAMLSL